MIKQRISINGYWDVIVLYNAPLGYKDVGFTHTDFENKRSIIGISKAKSKGELINTIVHEAKHLQSHICSYYNVSEDSEEAAYLIGYIVQKMYSCFNKGMV